VKVPFLELKPTYLELKNEFNAAWHRVMDSGQYLLGGELESFEQEYAAYCGAKNCVGVGSGLDALYLRLRAWKPVPPHLFGAYSDLGATPRRRPHAEEQSRTVSSLPIGPHLNKEAQNHVIAAIHFFR